MMKISGQFNVDLKPLAIYAEGAEQMNLGRMSIDKSFSGDLTATSKGEMLSVRTATAGSAGYVAIEQVTGTLGGHNGSFVLQHFGIMDRGADRLILEVVPDSGTGELTGLTGTMAIIFKDGQHYYEFEYELTK
jgi:Protein of unknown function (DUF3224)